MYNIYSNLLCLFLSKHIPYNSCPWRVKFLECVMTVNEIGLCVLKRIYHREYCFVSDFILNGPDYIFGIQSFPMHRDAHWTQSVGITIYFRFYWTQMFYDKTFSPLCIFYGIYCRRIFSHTSIHSVDNGNRFLKRVTAILLSYLLKIELSFSFLWRAKAIEIDFC